MLSHPFDSGPRDDKAGAAGAASASEKMVNLDRAGFDDGPPSPAGCLEAWGS